MDVFVLRELPIWEELGVESIDPHFCVAALPATARRFDRRDHMRHIRLQKGAATVIMVVRGT